jgi:hypothetical protein
MIKSSMTKLAVHIQAWGSEMHKNLWSKTSEQKKKLQYMTVSERILSEWFIRNRVEECD